MPELQPQPLPFADHKSGRHGGPLCIVDFRAPAAGYLGKRTFERSSGRLRRHAKRQWQGIRAQVEIRARGNPRDATPHQCLPELSHLLTPITL